MGAFLRRLRELVTRSSVAAEQDDEFRFHLEMEAERNRRLGMSTDEARRAAVLAFGARERFRDETLDRRGFVGIENLVRDARHAIRRLRRSPTFTVGAIVTLGIGLGASAGIGGIVHAVLLRDLPYADSDALVRVALNTPGSPGQKDLHTDATYVHLAASSPRSFEGFAAYYTNDEITLTEGDAAERVNAAFVTPGIFSLLGVRPVVGRFFAPSDTAWVESSPIIISEELWVSHFGRDPDIVGRSLELSLGTRDVVGVMPRSFDFPTAAIDVWYPARVVVSTRRASITNPWFTVIARVKPGVRLDAAQLELNTVFPALSSRYPAITPEILRRASPTLTVQQLKAATIEPVQRQLLLLGSMVFVVLVIAACNVVNLFLLRAERATKEVAVALSLGATRAAIARRFVVEGMVLGAASLSIAIPVAGLVMTTRLGFTAGDIPRLHEVTFGADIIAGTAIAALVIGAIVGLTTLTRTRGALTHGHLPLGTTRTTVSRPWRRAQRALVATQVAMALALVAVAGLLGRSFWNLRNEELGFDPSGATSFEVSLPFSEYLTYGAAASFHARTIDALHALPGATGAAVVSQLPLAATGSPEFPLHLEAVGRPGAFVASRGGVATSEYFDVMGIPIRRGRSFASGDLLGDPAVVLSESVARALFGTDEVVGRRIRRVDARYNIATTFQVIGVVGDVPGDRIEDGAAPRSYFPLLRDADGLPADSLPIPYKPRVVQYVVRSAIAPSAQTLRTLLSTIDPDVPPIDVRQVSSLVDAATARVSLLLLLLGVSGAAAIILGVVGVYSVASYAAAQREREFGVRMALGAAPRGVAGLVLREGALMSTLGIIGGLALAWASARFLSALLYEVSAVNPGVFAGAVALVVAVMLAATWIPARRASRTDPAVVLRGE